jgi:plastocyanin
MIAVWKMQVRKVFWRARILMSIFLMTAFTATAWAHLAYAAATAKKATQVSIVNFAFVSVEVTIAPGDTVTWTNNDGAPHGLEFHDGGAGTDLLLPGASFSRRFDRPGTYDYNCSIHPYMTGRVIVRARGTH